MSKRILILALAGSIACAEETLESCPYGHKSTVRIPILYGLIEPDVELQRKVEAREIHLGGCVVSEDHPDSLLSCTRCGSIKDYELFTRWALYSEDEAVLEVEPPDLLTAIDLGEIQRDSWYRRVFIDNGSDFVVRTIVVVGERDEIIRRLNKVFVGGSHEAQSHPALIEGEPMEEHCWQSAGEDVECKVYFLTFTEMHILEISTK